MVLIIGLFPLLLHRELLNLLFGIILIATVPHMKIMIIHEIQVIDGRLTPMPTRRERPMFRLRIRLPGEVLRGNEELVDIVEYLSGFVVVEGLLMGGGLVAGLLRGVVKNLAGVEFC